MATKIDTYMSGNPRLKPWRARVKHEGVEYFLGYFYTKEQAEQAEEQCRRYLRRYP